MALIIGFESVHGLDKPLYWRLNNFEQLANREPDGSRIQAVARFRGFVSEQAFRSGKHFLEEMLIAFTPSSSSGDMAAEAYAAFKAHDPSEETAVGLKRAQEALERALADQNEAETDEDKTLAANRREAAERSVAQAATLHSAAMARRDAIVGAIDA